MYIHIHMLYSVGVTNVCSRSGKGVVGKTCWVFQLVGCCGG